MSITSIAAETQRGHRENIQSQTTHIQTHSVYAHSICAMMIPNIHTLVTATVTIYIYIYIYSLTECACTN